MRVQTAQFLNHYLLHYVKEMFNKLLDCHNDFQQWKLTSACQLLHLFLVVWVHR